MRVLVTGASGLLGRAVCNAFRDAKQEVVGVAKSRVKNGLKQLDLTNASLVETFVNEHNPEVIVHCAAERRPDVAEKNREATQQLNVEVAGHLAALAAKRNALLIYVSTDYVFDGRNPPYEVHATPNPLNFYAQTKLQGERAVLAASSNAIVLRVPILYGRVEYRGESAVDILLEVVENKSAKKDVDHYARRYPTNVDDVARVIKDLTMTDVTERSGIFHFSAEECMTKYDMCVTFAEILGQSIDHLKPVDTVPASATAARPYDCHLSNRRLKELNIDTYAVPFDGWWKRELIRRK